MFIPFYFTILLDLLHQLFNFNILIFQYKFLLLLGDIQYLLMLLFYFFKLNWRLLFNLLLSRLLQIFIICNCFLLIGVYFYILRQIVQHWLFLFDQLFLFLIHHSNFLFFFFNIPSNLIHTLHFIHTLLVLRFLNQLSILYYLARLLFLFSAVFVFYIFNLLLLLLDFVFQFRIHLLYTL